MIRNFSASYAGHVVDENIGLEGMPANDRWYTNEQLERLAYLFQVSSDGRDYWIVRRLSKV